VKTEQVRNISSQFGEQESKSTYLTFDVDWCSDKVFAETLEILEKYNIQVTVFSRS